MGRACMKAFKALGILIAAAMVLSSCTDSEIRRLRGIDPIKDLDREDYRHMTDPNYVEPVQGNDVAIPNLHIEPPQIAFQKNNATPPPIPDLAEIIAAPKPPKIGATKVISVSVTDDVPLKDVLIELSKLADIDVEIDSRISGGITFRAKDRPFNEVIDRISNMAGLRYTMRNNVLRIERDLPYIQTYPLDMLNLDRASKGDIGVNSSGAGGGSGGDAGGGGSSGSSSNTITAESKGDFWEQFESGVKNILAYSPRSLGSAPDVEATAKDGGAAFYSLNRQAGTLTFAGTERQHEYMSQFIKAIESNISSQVLIEAKIVEVSLNDNYQTGIDWTKLGTDRVGFRSDFSSVQATDIAQSAAQITLLKNDIFGSGIDLAAAVDLLEEFGITRALSSPRLNAMNNQQAVLSFVENLVYFDVSIDVTDAISATTTSGGIPAKVEVTSEPKSAPVGIVLAMQPTINSQTNEITLNVRPTLSRVTQFITDPGFEIGKANAAAQLPANSPVITTLNSVTSQIPQLEVRELDSILKVTSGQVMVIGGLLEDTVTNNDAGIPGVSNVPYFGNLFKSVQRTNVKKELVILIRATIVPSSGSAHQSDRRLYEKFITDPRPLEF